MPREFAIGDIHGCPKTFQKMLFEELRVEKNDHIYLLGDYIDRGPDSKSVIEMIIYLQDKGYNIFPIMGNHEYMLIEACLSVHSLESWKQNGADTTLTSFGVDHPNKIEKKYLEFFVDLSNIYLTEEYVLVHAGLNFEIENPLDDKNSMLWNRDRLVDRDKIGGRRVICGHSPLPIFDIMQTLDENKIHLDGGCVYKGKIPGLGFLVGLNLKTLTLHTIENIDY
jgi:predicted MPP superfamily phosphohydrolase